MKKENKKFDAVEFYLNGFYVFEDEQERTKSELKFLDFEGKVFSKFDYEQCKLIEDLIHMHCEFFFEENRRLVKFLLDILFPNK